MLTYNTNKRDNSEDYKDSQLDTDLFLFISTNRNWPQHMLVILF